MWSVFLAWSYRIAYQGSSTVFMITATKNHAHDVESVEDGEYAPINRTEKWITPEVVASQG